MPKPSARVSTLHARVEEFALSLPGAWPDTPWGDSVVKVGKKIFVFLGDGTDPYVTVKLPETRDHALSLPGATLPGYGLGAHGWVSIPLAGLPAKEADVLFDFVEESYRTVAPKKLVKELDARLPEA